MRLKLHQLKPYLARSSGTLYAVSGDEPLQRMEALGQIRARLKEIGFTSRELFNVDTGFDWSRLTASLSTRSLFSERCLIELRLPTLKVTESGEGLKLLAQFRLDPDQALLVELPRIKKQSQSQAWFRNLETQGVVIEVWPLTGKDLHDWMRDRLVSRGLKPGVALIKGLVERTEGNLVAAAQEIDKLVLMVSDQAEDENTMLAALSDSARYQPDQWFEAALSGQLERGVRVLDGLRAEGVQVPFLIWVAARALRELAKMKSGPEMQGASFGPAARRAAALRAAMTRNLDPLPLLASCARIERMAKGAQAGSAWDELLELTAVITGKALMPENQTRR